MMRLFPVSNVVDSDDWYTPQWIFDGLGLTFDLDVAAPDGGAPNVPARAFFTVADDGLLQPWHGVVWCNPPYSAPTLWCRKWATHTDGCILIRAGLSTSGPFAAWTAAHACYVPPKRLQFESGAGRQSGAVNFSTVLLARGQTCTDALHRLATRCGGAARTLMSHNQKAPTTDSMTSEPITVGDLVLCDNGWNRVYELSATSLRVGSWSMNGRPLWVWRSGVRAIRPARATEDTP